MYSSTTLDSIPIELWLNISAIVFAGSFILTLLTGVVVIKLVDLFRRS